MRLWWLLLILALPAAQAAQPVTVAVASNFTSTATELATQFTAETGIEVRLVPGSTGKLYAQIVGGAPFDIFLAADQQRPQRLIESGHVQGDTRFTYAVGYLVLWSQSHEDCEAALRDPEAGHIAIANPLIAPYGVAAQEFLESQDLWNAVEDRLVFGENVMQATQFVATGNAGIGLIAAAIPEQGLLPQARCISAVPAQTYRPIRQDAVLLARAGKVVSAQRFFAFLKSAAARDIVVASGYGVSP